MDILGQGMQFNRSSQHLDHPFEDLEDFEVNRLERSCRYLEATKKGVEYFRDGSTKYITSEAFWTCIEMKNVLGPKRLEELSGTLDSHINVLSGFSRGELAWNVKSTRDLLGELGENYINFAIAQESLA